MNKKYKHIFFDLDHTLWDFDRNSAYTLRRLHTEHKLADHGVDDIEQFILYYNEHNAKLWKRFRNGYIRRDELRWKRFWLALLDFKIGNTNLAHELSAAYLEVMPTQPHLTPHAKEVLDYLQEQDYTIHLMTNGFELTQKMKLQYSGIATYFHEIITSEKSYGLKPHPSIYEYAMKTVCCEKEDCIMIGDALDVDIAGAMNIGWDQIYYNPHKEQHDKKPTYEVACLSDLKGIL